MSEPAGGRVLVLSRTWWLPRSESAFVLRTLSGALSRHVTVDVLTPGPESSTIADGLFDVRTLGGVGTAASWPRPFDVSPEEVRGSIAERPVAALVEAGDGFALELLARHEPELPTILVGVDPDEAAAALSASTGGKPPRSVGLSPLDVGLHVPVNPLAAQRPHNGFGFTDYLLVLTDRPQCDLHVNSCHGQRGRPHATGGVVDRPISEQVRRRRRECDGLGLALPISTRVDPCRHAD